MSIDDKHASSLRDFYKQITVGNSALSLRSRKEMALIDYEPLAERVKEGDANAFDDFKDKASILLEIERELHGSQIGYFDRLGEVTAITEAALKRQSQTKPEIMARRVQRKKPPSSAELGKWWSNLSGSDRFIEQQCVTMACQAFPANHVSRNSIRELRGPQKRGPKSKSQPHGET